MKSEIIMHSIKKLPVSRSFPNCNVTWLNTQIMVKSACLECDRLWVCSPCRTKPKTMNFIFVVRRWVCSPCRTKPKTYEFHICCSSLSTQHLKERIKACWLGIGNNVSEWSIISSRGLLFQWPSTVKFY